jgi:YHS domain-containing protein
MKMLTTVIVLLGFVYLIFGDGSFSVAAQPNQTQCPVMGSTVNKKIYTDYAGKRIYFCCPPCISEFKRDPEKYMKKMKEQGVVLEDAPGSSGK